MRYLLESAGVWRYDRLCSAAVDTQAWIYVAFLIGLGGEQGVMSPVRWASGAGVKNWVRVRVFVRSTPGSVCHRMSDSRLLSGISRRSDATVDDRRIEYIRRISCYLNSLRHSADFVACTCMITKCYNIRYSTNGQCIFHQHRKALPLPVFG